jgi:hypothetical protein
MKVSVLGKAPLNDPDNPSDQGFSAQGDAGGKFFSIEKPTLFVHHSDFYPRSA